MSLSTFDGVPSTVDRGGGDDDAEVDAFDDGDVVKREVGRRWERVL